jgi:hypothetical protein
VVYSITTLLNPVDFGNPVEVAKIYSYLVTHQADQIPWYQQVSVMDHIANVALFSIQIAKRIKDNGTPVDVNKCWLMAWLRDIGRVAMGIAKNEGLDEITQKYGKHHGLLGYELLTKSGINRDLAIITMTHIGGGITAQEAQQINRKLDRDLFPVEDWYAKTLEEKIIVIADKIPGWNNTIIAPYEAQKNGDTKGIKMYDWLDDQSQVWHRFWSFKKEVDDRCKCNVLDLFDPGLLSSAAESYSRLPPHDKIAKMSFA